MQEKTAIITGVRGQDASILSELLLDQDYKVYGILRRTSDNSLGNSSHLVKNINFVPVEADLLDLPSILKICNQAKPDLFFNTAAMSHVGTSFSQPVYTAQATGVGVINCLEAIRISGIHTRFLQCSSSEMFGGVSPEPANEETLFHPRSPYGVAKCLSAHTKIYTDQGLVKINKIKPGDKVWGHDGQLHQVNKVFSRPYKAKEMYNIWASTSCGFSTNKDPSIIQSNLQITCTPEHKILTEQGWKEAQELIIGIDKIAVVATNCKICNKKIPSNRKFCSSECNAKAVWQNPIASKKIRESLSESRKNNISNGMHFTKKWRESHTKGVGKNLAKIGKNYQEFYLDLLIQNAAPGFFTFNDGKYPIDGFFPDWVNMDKKAVIEYIGWGETIPERMKNFEKKLERLNELGWKILVIKGKEYRRPKEIQQRVAEFCSSLGSVEYIFVPIQKINTYIKKQNHYVYDLEINDAHSFIANGIVVHNCFGHWATINYRETYKMFACCSICFNHTEPGRRGPNFVTRKITLGIKDILCGNKTHISLGNLDAKRDWSLARDVCRGMIMMLQASEPDDYVLATGETHTVREFCEIAFSYAGLGDYNKYIVIDPQLYRPAEVNVLLGDYSKIKNKLGWEPTVKFNELVKLMVDFDLGRNTNS